MQRTKININEKCRDCLVNAKPEKERVWKLERMPIYAALNEYYYITSCHRRSMLADKLVEHNFKRCPFCGLKLKEK